MITKKNVKVILQELRVGPFGLYIDEFLKNIQDTGYSEICINRLLLTIRALSRSVILKEVNLANLNQAKIDKFIASQWGSTSYASKLHRSHLKTFCTYLQDKGVIPERIQSIGKLSPIDKCIKFFDIYLENEKGLMASYRRQNSIIAQMFLQSVFVSKTLCIKKIKQEDISKFIFDCARTRNPQSISKIASLLRSFLRFLELHYRLKVNLSSFVLPVAVWKQDRIPEYLTEQDVKTVLKQCDRTKIKGLRDYTILRLLSRLGLRAAEVSKLTLDDFDWDKGEVIIRGKGSKIHCLPISQDLGDDLVAYLQKGRPSCSCRSFFVSFYAPFIGLTPYTIGIIATDALRRTGHKKGGAHLLRHSLAYQLLQKNASLQEIGKVLRHKSINTTAIYAKVDIKRLRQIALPWPVFVNFGGIL
jgi:integrase/recombinase XerD